MIAVRLPKGLYRVGEDPHVGLSDIEGHEGETTDQSLRYLEEFKNTVPFRIAAQGEYADGDSEPRTIAILIRD